MFSVLAGRTGLGLAPDDVVAIIESINSPNIAVPGHGTEPAKCFLVGARAPSGNFGLFIYLLLLESNLPVIFVSDTGEVPLDGYPSLEGEAIQFAESMGFMLDNMNFRARPPAEQAELINTLPIFMPAPPARSSVVPAAVDIDAVPGTVIPGDPTANVPSTPPTTTPPQRASVFPPEEIEALGRLLGAF